MSIAPFTKEEHRRWHNSQPAKRCAAGAVCINEKGQILVVKATYKSYWSLPGGIVDANESPRRGALRELEEEVGVSVDERVTHFGGVVYYPSWDGHLDITYFLFKTNLASQATIKADGYEIEAAKWISPAELRKVTSASHKHILLAADLAEGKEIPSYIDS